MATHDQRKIVLVVEDSPTQSIHTKMLLEQRNLRVVLASNGQSGLYLAQSLLPQLIILDLELPKVNGYEVSRVLSENQKTRGIPVILMTRFSKEECAVQGIDIDNVRYIPKDAFANAVLLEMLKQIGL